MNNADLTAGIDAYREALNELLTRCDSNTSHGWDISPPIKATALMVIPWMQQVHRFGKAFLSTAVQARQTDLDAELAGVCGVLAWHGYRRSKMTPPGPGGARCGYTNSDLGVDSRQYRAGFQRTRHRGGHFVAEPVALIWARNALQVQAFGEKVTIGAGADVVEQHILQIGEILIGRCVAALENDAVRSPQLSQRDAEGVPVLDLPPLRLELEPCGAPSLNAVDVAMDAPTLRLRFEHALPAPMKSTRMELIGSHLCGMAAILRL